MVRCDTWEALSPDEVERVRSAGSVRIGEMPLWVDERDDSRWFVASDSRTQFTDNARLLDEMSAQVFPGPPEWAKPLDLDVGPALLDPVTEEERAALDDILAELWRTIDSGQLSDTQAVQIRTMADLLEEAGTEAVPEETERWRTVGAVRTVLGKTVTVAGFVVSVDKLVAIVNRVGWTELGRYLQGLIS